jgi:excinuclease ABC subunit C
MKKKQHHQANPQKVNPPKQDVRASKKYHLQRPKMQSAQIQVAKKADMMEFNIAEELRKLPGKPGVYLMHDEMDQIIYVGKAINLKNRVRQYFQTSRNKGPKIEQMVTHIRRFEYIVTDSELEALVLECNLIKEHHPKYNTMLMDDKAYPFIKVTVQEAFPRVLLARKRIKDKAKYFGPYTSVGAVRDTLDLIHKLYHIRSCNRNLPKDTGKDRPCLNYHIKQCDAPCQAYISQEKYREAVQDVIRFLSGKFDTVLKDLEQKMQEASEALEFEKAVEYRELLFSVRKISEKQKITDQTGEDRDILAVASEGEDAVVQVFFIRGGRLIGRDHFYLRIAKEETHSAILESFLTQYYAGTPFLPSELVLSDELEDVALYEEWLGKKRGGKVTIHVPKKGTKEKLVELATQNAQLVLGKDMERLKREAGRTTGAVQEIADLLGLQQIDRMEAFDISNTSGFQSVGSMVVYEQGKPKRNDYRKFKIQGITGADDYGSMREVLTRRFTHGLKEQEENRIAGKFTVFPDLILMDGGKGQVHVAEQVLEELHLAIPVCGMVKDDHHRTRGLYYQDQEVPIDRSSEAFRLITRIQDEAHRFAIEYHRQLRSKGQVHSILDEIEGIGPTRRKALMREFISIDAIKAASVEELAKVPSMNERAANFVYTFFHGNIKEEKDE